MSTAVLATSLFAAPSYAKGTTHTPKPRAVCDPSTKTKSNAPAIGAQATYQAGNAGSVVVKRADATNLSIVSVNDTAGWTNTVSTPSGRRVRALLRNSGAGQLQHFGLGLSARGTFVMETTSFCHH